MPENQLPNDPVTTDTTKQTTNTSLNKTLFENKKALGIIGAALGLLFLVLIILVVMLLNKNNDTDGTAQNDTTNSSQQASGNSDAQNSSGDREVLVRAPTSNDKLEYVIYKPKQNAANTTIYFAVENVCEGCEDSVGAYNVVSSFDSKSNSYLLDDNNGKKYSPITDEDGDVLATPSCSEWLKFGEKQECFVAFAKVPSGSTVSWVFGKTRIENIKVE